MKVITATKRELVLEFDEKQRYRNSFIFDIAVIMDVPEARAVVIRDPSNKKRQYRMSGKKFWGDTLCIGDAVMLPKDMLRYRVVK